MKILGFKIPIVYMPNEELEDRYAQVFGEDEAGMVLGNYDGVRKVINLNEDVYSKKHEGGPDEEETRLHETIEAINSITGIEMSHPQIATLSAVLHQVFVDNGYKPLKWK